MTEGGNTLAREIARMVLEDLATNGALKPSTFDVLLMEVSRQPVDPAAIPFEAARAATALPDGLPVGAVSKEAVARLARFTAAVRGRIVRHSRRGSSYRVLGLGRLQTAETLGDTASVVIYQGEDGSLWARPPHEMWDGRFALERDVSEAQAAGSQDGRS